jgi:NAD(P)H-dependent FMN reductase
MTKLMIIIGSVRPGRVGLPVAEWVTSVASADDRFEIDVVDLAELNLPMMDEPNHPRLRQYTKEHTKEWSARVDAADAFVFVAPEYNYSYGPALKNAIDFLHSEWFRKPLGVASYGGISGGTRGAAAIRATVATLGLVSTTANVEIPYIAKQIDDDGKFVPNERNELMLAHMLTEIAALDGALRPLRTSAA